MVESGINACFKVSRVLRKGKCWLLGAICMPLGYTKLDFIERMPFILPLQSHLYTLYVRILSQHTINRSVLKILPLSFFNLTFYLIMQ